MRHLLQRRLCQHSLRALQGARTAQHHAPIDVGTCGHGHMGLTRRCLHAVCVTQCKRCGFCKTRLGAGADHTTALLPKGTGSKGNKGGIASSAVAPSSSSTIAGGTCTSDAPIGVWDSNVALCEDFCDEKERDAHCQLCKCKACEMCAAPQLADTRLKHHVAGLLTACSGSAHPRRNSTLYTPLTSWCTSRSAFARWRVCCLRMWRAHASTACLVSSHVPRTITGVSAILRCQAMQRRPHVRVGVLPTTGQAIAACARFALLLLHVHTHGSEHRTHACACIRMSKSGKSGKSGRADRAGWIGRSG